MPAKYIYYLSIGCHMIKYCPSHKSLIIIIIM